MRDCEGMDEGLMDEVAPVDVAEVAHIQRKEIEYPLKSENCNIVEPRDLHINKENDYSESSFHVLAKILEGEDVDGGVNSVNASEGRCASPRYMDDAGNMVEELMVRNDSTSNVAVVGTSNNRERLQTRQNQWQHLYQLAGGSGSASSRGDSTHRDDGQAMPSSHEDVDRSSFSESLAQKPSIDGRVAVMERLTDPENEGVMSGLSSHGGIRTKILSKSGFSQFFVKNTLKGKGVIYRGPPQNNTRIVPKEQNNAKAAVCGVVAPSASMDLIAQNKLPYSCYTRSGPGSSTNNGVNLREWLSTRREVNKIESLNIFRQVLDLVDHFHSQEVALLDLQPSAFKLLQSNQVKYLGSTLQREMSESVTDQEIPFLGNGVIRRRPLDQGMFPSVGLCGKKQKFSENGNLRTRWPFCPSKYGFKLETANDIESKVADKQNSRDEYDQTHHIFGSGIQRKSSSPPASSTALQQSASIGLQLEVKWYKSPEELSEGVCTISSNIYSLGVLFFELLGHFDSERAHDAALMDLRHRILPPTFLSENPKEAGFCLWLLYPDPRSRPTTREIVQSEVINGLHDVSLEELSSSIDQDDAESELSLHFLNSLKGHKEKHAVELAQDIRCVEADIEEIERRNCPKSPLIHPFLNNDLLATRDVSSLRKATSSSEAISRSIPKSPPNEMRWVRNINHLESAYFSMRFKVQHPEIDGSIRPDRDLLRNCENRHSSGDDEANRNPTDHVGAFFDGMCKYARFSKFEACGLLRTGDFNNSANVICSLSFDRDEDYFAAAWVSKKIKIFEFNALFNDSVDIHYPVAEMSNKSKLSCICWNNYIKNYLASTDYDGVVKLWDASTGQGVSQYSEHNKRAWSVDFSQVHPTKLASGSDDCSVKLWSISEKNCLGTIRNIANICCVQFSAHSTNLLAFGSADYRTYCYDLRNARVPWCVLPGHAKAVSYVKFLDSETLVTASTDNTLKIWDLNKTSSGGLSTDACSLTLRGHTNEKNFVGLSISNGYIGCGSETNEVYAYYRSLPMPITSHKFGSVDPISGKETDDDNGQFVSSVCWRGKSDMVVAANSSGCIKVLRMV
ncbi:protein SPA1-RELATED 2 [Tripterygium wilfordii]|uniref:Protein SPA1-RELATED 2 n=1 Tax=Tripterygium wilfordii TaxID=458696 RepID=A0A7J7CJG9_TRIWF|nr:protein SPA1-RELATED 2-like [Tripterygium wilfordii]KAF5734207.1 protein SPA1-RELATED 2 [Tripterygium wilfordii]